MNLQFCPGDSLSYLTKEKSLFDVPTLIVVAPEFKSRSQTEPLRMLETLGLLPKVCPHSYSPLGLSVVFLLPFSPAMFDDGITNTVTRCHN